LSRLAPQIDAGMPFIVLEPSCASVFLEELRNFYPHSDRAQRLARQTFLLADFLAEHAPNWQPPSLAGRKVVLHGHCHHKSVFNMKAERALLEQTGAQVTMLDSGCCGMAGPFGFERDKYTVSQDAGGTRAAARSARCRSQHRRCDRWLQLPGADRAGHQAARRCTWPRYWRHRSSAATPR